MLHERGQTVEDRLKEAFDEHHADLDRRVTAVEDSLKKLQPELLASLNENRKIVSKAEKDINVSLRDLTGEV